MRLLFAVVLLALIAATSASGVSLAAGAAPDAEGKAGAKGHRLAATASPYLRQHADNPVEWYPWGEEAFGKARKENKPIFLSVGYSTCYWCHVMERESFQNADIAAVLNEHFVSVKVDRERRPDVDATYMIATELIARNGGWPNSVFLTPDLKPFFALTYAPPQEFKELVERAAATWQESEAPLRADAERMAGLIARISVRGRPPISVTEKVLARASLSILSGFDAFNGGIGTAPKFPREQVLAFLQRRVLRDGDAVAAEALEITLDNIIRGGIHDHVAGGFHRYATDNAWAVPHFEKMLYNQAEIGRILIGAYERTGERRYADAARKTFDFVMSDMTTPEGGFASAFDAETDGVEGLYYLWSLADLQKAAGPDAEFATAVFAATKDGNHEGLNTLRLSEPIADLAKTSGLGIGEFEAKLTALLTRLKEARDSRPALRRDDKVIADWNAAMIRTLAQASLMLDEPRYLAAATKAMDLLVGKLAAGTPDMQRAYYESEAGLDASQADHAGVGLAAIALFDATGDEKWRDLARRSARVIIEKFADQNAGDYFLTSGETGFVRTKQYDDGDLPSGNAAALQLFSALSRRDADPDWRHAADRLADALSGLAENTPVAMAGALVAIDEHLRGEIGTHQVAGKGAVKVVARRGDDRKSARIEIELAPGWHINARQPGEDFFIPTVLKIAGREPEGVVYPEALERKLGFHDDVLKLYEGTVALEYKLDADESAAAGPHRASLSIQACSDKICLSPETVELIVPGPSLGTL